MATLIGDLVGSRSSPDRAALHDRLAEVLAQANDATCAPSYPCGSRRATSSREASPRSVRRVHASLWLRLALLPDDLRHGIGWGEVSVLARGAAGGGRARLVGGAGGHRGGRARRDPRRPPGTCAPPTAAPRDVDGPDPRAVNAALLCRDQMVGSASERSIRLLRGALRGRTQAELATQEGISASAVSQRFRHDGLGVLIAADELLREV